MLRLTQSTTQVFRITEWIGMMIIYLRFEISSLAKSGRFGLTDYKL